MGLNEKKQAVTYVNIKEGMLVVKKDNTIKNFNSIDGRIKRVLFQIDEYEGKKYEKAIFVIDDIGETFYLQMRTSSGYFRGLCNSLKSSTKPKEIVEINPFKKDGKTTCFVTQEAKVLKHTHTRDNMGDLPELEVVEFKGEKHWDGTKQIDYWKKWLNEIFNTDSEIPTESKTTYSNDEVYNTQEDYFEPSTSLDDLPF